jgi:Apolipoprotein N-acyltransferase
MLVAILAARAPETLQLEGQVRWLPATPWQGFLLGYVCGILWFAGTCYWIFDTMHRYGNLPVPAAALALLLFCMYVGLYHGFFGLLLALVAGGPFLSKTSAAGKISGTLTSNRRALAAAPFLWVAVELARTRITGFPWELLGYSQTDNFALTRVATLVGVYGLSFEILLVNSVFAAAFLAPKENRNWLLAAACGAAAILQAGQLLPLPSANSITTLFCSNQIFPSSKGRVGPKTIFKQRCETWRSSVCIPRRNSRPLKMERDRLPEPPRRRPILSFGQNRPRRFTPTIPYLGML